jgi:hypothetical protein
MTKILSEIESKKIEVKVSEMQTFHDLIIDQFKFGGVKYAFTGQREATDELFDSFSYLFLMSTICKYCFRFKTMKAEKEMLKIATYSYLLWLKRGYYANPQGTSEITDTNLKIKSAYFNTFLDLIEFSEDIKGDIEIDDLCSKVKEMTNRQLLCSSQAGRLIDLIQIGFNKITEEDLIYIYKTCYNIWKKNFSETPGLNTDTGN